MFVFDLPENADRTAYYYLQKANAKINKNAAIGIWIFRALFLILAVIDLFLAFRLWPVMFDDKAVAMTILMVLLGLFCLFYAIFYFRLLAWRGARYADRNRVGKGQMTFSDEQISMSDEKMSSTVGYDTIQRIFQKDGDYFLFISRNRAIIASVACLSEGSAEAFPDFLTEKTNLKIETI